MEDTITLQAADFASVRKNIGEEGEQPEGLAAAIEYNGSRGPISCFYRVTFTPDIAQKFPGCTAVKFREEENGWQIILYMSENRLSGPFAAAEMDALCEKWDIQLAR